MVKLKKYILLLLKFIPTLRIQTANWYNLQIYLKRELKRLPWKNKVLDVGSKKSPYKKYLKFKKYQTLDISNKFKPDIVADILDFKSLKKYEDDFDLILMTEVLEHIKEPQLAVNNLNKLLKKGGTCVITTPFFYPIHGDPDDYYRYTGSALKYLFKDYSKVRIISRGNKILAIWSIFNCPIRSGILISIFFNIFNPFIARLDLGKKSIAPIGYVVIAEK